jgi:hypothetical protein
VYLQMLNQGTRKARKAHRCFHCCRDIAPGTVYGFQTNKYDDVYTICWHLDCEELASKCRDLSGGDYDDEGWRGLREEWCASGEYYSECDGWRGHYPHVVARMELFDQLREARRDK